MLKSDTITVPVSIRLPGELATQLYGYAQAMNTSPAKIIGSLLEDAFPAFESGRHDIRLRISQVYKAMEGAKLLYSVNPAEVRERVYKRCESGGPMGRPRKRKVNQDGGNHETPRDRELRDSGY